MEEIVKAYRQTGSLRATASACDTQWQKVRKVLITTGDYSNDKSELIESLYAKGKTEIEIANQLNMSTSTVNSYLPYTKGHYLSDDASDNAKRIRKHREHMQNSDKRILDKKFGHWTPLDRVNGAGAAEYLCECSCGVRKVVTARTLLNGTSKSCGHTKKDYDFPDRGKLMNEIQKENLIENTNLLILNQKVARNSTTGVKGVHPTKNGKYRAYINFKGKRTYLGFFDTLEEAKKAREDAEEELYKPFLYEHDN